MLANLAKWQNSAKGVYEMFRLNILSFLEGSQNVGENGEFGKSGYFGEISPRLCELFKVQCRVSMFWIPLNTF